MSDLKPITMQDVRLIAGEGKLEAWTVLEACNVINRQRHERSEVRTGDAALIAKLNEVGLFGKVSWQEAEQLCKQAAAALTVAAAQGAQQPRIAERLADVVMMLDAPDAYNREYIAAVCRSILSSVPSAEGK